LILIEETEMAMNPEQKVVSKVLVLDTDPVSMEQTKIFCEEHGLIGLKVQPDNVMFVLKSNVDLGGVLIAENFGRKALGGIAMGRKINQVRPELPIFLRRESSHALDDLSERDRRPFRAAYTLQDMSFLKAALDESIFSLDFPQILLRGVSEMTKAALESQFIDMSAETETPYMVRDQLIYGELFTMIPIDSSWCRGYMMLQTEERGLVDLVKADRTHIVASAADDFRSLNSILGEITNLIWGAFKNRFMSVQGPGLSQSQVPIVVNHLHRYISFGSSNPQLCFKYTMTDRTDTLAKPLVVYQKFVFNLSWSPENFSENAMSVTELVASGELELF